MVRLRTLALTGEVNLAATMTIFIACFLIWNSQQALLAHEGDITRFVIDVEK